MMVGRTGVVNMRINLRRGSDGWRLQTCISCIGANLDGTHKALQVDSLKDYYAGDETQVMSTNARLVVLGCKTYKSWSRKDKTNFVKLLAKKRKMSKIGLCWWSSSDVRLKHPTSGKVLLRIATR